MLWVSQRSTTFQLEPLNTVDCNRKELVTFERDKPEKPTPSRFTA